MIFTGDFYVGDQSIDSSVPRPTSEWIVLSDSAEVPNHFWARSVRLPRNWFFVHWKFT